jgi:pimeloyl-ACP methyl ester carboxylesterase
MAAQVLPHEVRGEGEHKVICLHGWFADRGAFRGLWPHLDERRFSYAFVDYRGYGEAKGVAGGYDLMETAGDVLATADALGWDEFSVLGHSMGGKVAQALLAAAPGRCAGWWVCPRCLPPGCRSTISPGSCSPRRRTIRAAGARSSTSPPATG